MALSMAPLEISCEVVVSPPLRLLVEQHVCRYHIQAFPACRPKKTVVYVEARSSAIVAYVLGPDWRALLNETDRAKYRGTGDDWSEEDEQNLAMRIIQAGGTVLDTTKPRNEPFVVQRAQQFAAFSRTKKYVFGWPPQGGLWVLHLDGLVPWEYWQPDDLPFDASNSEIFTAEAIEQMEKETANPFDHRCSVPDGAIDLSDLNKAETMEQYCAELTWLDATFYSDPSESGEASRSGLFDKDILTTTWSGFASWSAWLERGAVHVNVEPCAENSVNGRTRFGCVIS